MASYQLSRAADKDLTDIYAFTVTEFGERQADLYFGSLEDCLTRLAANPRLGRDAGAVRKGYRRFVHRRHSIYYKRTREGILVIRVLGPGMLAERSAF
ncbi:MAG: type II toxin-antitoxin system RelE/ParE family toxin [Chromatiales bacterium]|nr:MAG: type II toxin-antitoxin system RelE/ParE family toxin [Chromatiales bacterium]